MRRACLLSLLAASAFAQTTSRSLAVMQLEANEAAASQAPAVSALLSSRLAESPNLRVFSSAELATLIGVEKQRQMFQHGSCDDSCLTELSGAVGARYVVSGRIDRFGTRYILSATLFDSSKATTVTRSRAEAESDGDLPRAVDLVASELLPPLGAPPVEARLGDGGFVLSGKAGSNFISSLGALSPNGQLELGVRFAHAWIAFAEIGVTLIVAGNSGGSGGINVVPSILGIRRLYRLDTPLQPYWGAGIGFQLSFGEFGFFTNTGPLPSLVAIGGLQYMFTQRFGAMIELSTNVAQMLLGVANQRQGSGINLNATLGVTYRF